MHNKMLSTIKKVKARGVYVIAIAKKETKK